MPSITHLQKPSNAGWLAKAIVHPDGTLEVHPTDGATIDDAALPPNVEIAWYEGGRIKITVPTYCPAVIRQAYLTGSGRDTIIEIAPRPEAE